MYRQKMKRVAVLVEGMSSEREISLLTGQGVMKALNKLGYDAKDIVVSSDLSLWLKQLQKFSPDVVFNALHGKYGEDGCIQGILNWLKIPYTHSGVLASALGMDKECTRQIAQTLGIKVAPGGLKTPEEFQKMALPLVVKPNDEGSSCGVYLVKTEADRAKVLRRWPKEKKLLVEEYIDGRELSVAVLDGTALTSVELHVKKGWYDYKNKYQEGAVVHEIPAPLSKATQDLILRQSEKIHQALGCRGVSRSDFRLSPTGQLYFLEINTNPGMTPLSLVPDMARAKGISYEQVVEKLIQEARCD